ncbi:MAG: DUF433 domain-containing protein [Chloroflexota bacterium]|nr:DUF433 domain-containing protein [Chloroflexota bacterium]
MDEIVTPGITRKSGVRGGRPCIEGTGIRVTDIVTAVQLDYSRDEIADDFDISLQQVEAALTYYDRNTVAIDEDIKRQDENFERISKLGYGRPKTPVLPR